MSPKTYNEIKNQVMKYLSRMRLSGNLRMSQYAINYNYQTWITKKMRKWLSRKPLKTMYKIVSLSPL